MKPRSIGAVGAWACRGACVLAAGMFAAGAASAQQFTMKLSSPTINDVRHEVNQPSFLQALP